MRPESNRQTPLFSPLVLGIALATLATACAPFRAHTPSGMAELHESRWSAYDYRATTPDGVVIAARQIRQREGGETPRAELDFWIDALELRMRTTAGYALLDESEVESADGTDGRRLEFGRDADGDTYVYEVNLFVTRRFVHVVEAGGERALFEEHRERIDEAVASYVVRR